MTTALVHIDDRLALDDVTAQGLGELAPVPGERDSVRQRGPIDHLHVPKPDPVQQVKFPKPVLRTLDAITALDLTCALLKSKPSPARQDGPAEQGGPDPFQSDEPRLRPLLLTEGGQLAAVPSETAEH